MYFFLLFQCLWKRCGKVLSSASGMQRHIRLVHLGCGGAGRGEGQECQAGFCFNPTFIPRCSPDPAGGRLNWSRAMARRTSTTQSWIAAWTR